MKLFIKIIICLILALFIWEVILELTILKAPAAKSHPVLGRIMDNGLYIYGQEGFTITTINNFGMRGKEIKQKSSNEFRILALGDSYTEAFQVMDNKTFCYLLENSLNGITNKNRVTIINAGVSGASPARYIHLANYYEDIISPDYTIVQVMDTDFRRDIFDKSKGFYVAKDISGFSTRYQDTSNTLIREFPGLSCLTSLSVLRVGIKKFEEIIDVYEKGSKPIKVKAKKDNHDEIIEWTVKSLKNNYKKVVILYMPEIDYNNIYLPPTEIEITTKKYADKYGVDFINMRVEFNNYYLLYKQPVHGFNNTIPGVGHINEKGHELVAKELLRYFSRRISK